MSRQPRFGARAEATRQRHNQVAVIGAQRDHRPRRGVISLGFARRTSSSGSFEVARILVRGRPAHADHHEGSAKLLRCPTAR
jgi:hypothetical protein